MTNFFLGKVGENIAAEYLKSRGHFIINRNYRNDISEIDIISRKEGEFFLTEVKTRKSFEYGHPFEYITKSKIRKIIRCFDYYMLLNGLNSCFFVSAIGIIIDVNGEIKLEYIEKI